MYVSPRSSYANVLMRNNLVYARRRIASVVSPTAKLMTRATIGIRFGGSTRFDISPAGGVIAGPLNIASICAGVGVWLGDAMNDCTRAQRVQLISKL